MFPERYSVIVVGAPEAGVLEFCAYLASFYQRSDQDVVIVETDTSSELVRRMMTEYNANADMRGSASVKILDCFDETESDDGRIQYSDLSNLSGLLEKIGSTMDELREPVRVIFDSLSSLYIHNAADDVTSFLEKLIRLTKEKGSLTATLHENMHPVEQVVALTSQCDGVIEMMADENMERFIRIKRMKDLPVRPNWVPFEPIVAEGMSSTSLIWKK